MARYSREARERTKSRAGARSASGSNNGRTLDVPEGLGLFKPEAKDATYQMNIYMYEVTKEGHPAGAEVGEYEPYRRYWTHDKVGPNKSYVICPRSFGKPCPICELFDELEAQLRIDMPYNKDASQADKDEFKRRYKAINVLKPKEKLLYAVDVDGGKLQLFNTTPTKFGDPLEDSIKTNKLVNPGIELYCDDDEGYTLVVSMKEEGEGRMKYAQTSAIVFPPANRGEVSTDILDNVPKLDDILVEKTYEELKGLLDGTVVETEQQSEKEEVKENTAQEEPTPEKAVEPEKPKKTSRRKKSTPKKQEEKPVEEEAPKEEPQESEGGTDDNSWEDQPWE